MRIQVTEVSIFQNAKFLAVLYVPISLIYVLMGLGFIASGLDGLMFIGIIFILSPIWLTAMVYVMVAIFATIYNFLASKIGGVEFELTEIPKDSNVEKDNFGY